MQSPVSEYFFLFFSPKDQNGQLPKNQNAKLARRRTVEVLEDEITKTALPYRFQVGSPKWEPNGVYSVFTELVEMVSFERGAQNNEKTGRATFFLP